MLPTWLWLLLVVALLAASWWLASSVFGHGVSTAPKNPIVAFTRSSCMTPAQLRIMRIAFAVVFVIALFYDMYVDWEGGYWFIYLTHWSFCLETAYMVMLALVGNRMMKDYIKSEYEGLAMESNSASAIEEPMIVKVYMALNAITLPLCVLVTVIYWTALNPVWKMCLFNNDEPGCKALARTNSLCVHFFNTVFIMIQFLDSEIPYHFRNAGWVIIFCGVYGIWTIIHFFLKIGNGKGCPKFGYPTNECPIYDIINWHKPESTLIVVAGLTLVLAPLINLACVGLAAIRDEIRTPIK